ncbi:L-asparaginase [Paenibacillus sp. CAA11]|uniref:asparaginase n=1 Tax=Paenibacillus sp. CAA11 TaxID=1532905 RepID=UPI000D33F55A|nr:asparaginase [Paenibacillus sp. CAA11]AWB43631.1 L-asparaginase [Paenibacillus sp. CAA11]
MSQAIQVYRGSYLESTHHIHVAVVHASGKLLYAYGDPYRRTFPRSSMKPFQAVPLIETGAAQAYSYSASDISLSCASHSGEVIHRSAVLDILSRAHLEEEDLQCGTHEPRDKESYKQLIREGKELTPVFSNCSGKHSGMLVTALYMGEDIKTYREVTHPVQQRILKVISDVCDIPAEEIELSVDGCGVPVHRLPLYNTALGFARLAQPEEQVSAGRAAALSTIREAMTAHPEMVAGTKRLDTDLMRAFGGRVVAKVGAEGVQCMGITDLGIGIAIKTEDGTARAAGVAAMEVLRQLGVADEAAYEKLKDYAHAPVYNARNEVIGVIEPNFILEPVDE